MNVYRGSEWNKWDLHVHTASSYDHKYKSPDSDDLLCKALADNNIRAVAITDHFKIDKERFKNLKTKAPDIVFFPGVELRTDKGANNLHLILIFSEKSDIDALSDDFTSIMIRSKSKAPDSDETIYWDFDDIIEFAQEHNGLISIHAGRKKNGIDREITNALPVQEAIKEEIAKSIDFFEIGQLRDIENYKNYVFKSIDPKPLILCSDNHDPRNYSTKEPLWIKADLTFEGLKQCLFQPSERVYIGLTPPVLNRFNTNKQVNIDKISIKRVDNPRNDSVIWFDTDIPLNYGMVAIIGNKGSGKSALSDIIGHLCKCKNMERASFLNSNRFKKKPKNYADDYNAEIVWADGETKIANLSEELDQMAIEDAQYLPQKYIEDVCNNLENEFQHEIDKVIFSYVDYTERGEAQNLQEFVRQKSHSIELRIQSDIDSIKDLNSKIIALEKKMTESYRNRIINSFNKAFETLTRHDNSKPKEVKKTEPMKTDSEYDITLKKINSAIEQNRKRKDEIIATIAHKNTLIDDATAIIGDIEDLESRCSLVKEKIDSFFKIFQLKQENEDLTLRTPKDYLNSLIENAKEDKIKNQDLIDNSENGIDIAIQNLNNQKQELIATADVEEKQYQKYLSDLDEWEKRRNDIIGNKDIEGSLEYFKYEKEYLESLLEKDYYNCTTERDNLTQKLHSDKTALLSVYQSIYEPIQRELTKLLGNIDNNIRFKAELFMSNANIVDNIKMFIDQRMKGRFGKSSDTNQEIEKLVRDTNFCDSESVLSFVHSITEAISEDLEQADKKISNRQGFYDFLYCLNYIDVSFKLNLSDRSLNELSPGERGIVLLVFYLALSKESTPIIIDQPEDNLDNQSIFCKLVPCILNAKQRRQIIVVTHNPNIAIACDAEQIIFCEMDKNTCQIRYTAGSIENPEIRKHVVDVLEGTKPAFDLRSKKYN